MDSSSRDVFFSTPVNVKGVKSFAVLWKILCLMTVSWFLLACASSETLDQATDASGVPVWVNQGSNILTSKEGRRFRGVGSAPALGDFPLQTSTAENRARHEITRIVASYIEIVSRDYIASGDAAEAGFTGQTVAKQMDQLSSIDLKGVEVVGHWQDTDSKVIYAVAAVDMQKVKDVIKNAPELNPGLREFISSEGDSIFDRISNSEE